MEKFSATNFDTACDVSVVLPCLNESKTVEVCIRKALGQFEQLGVRGEVVVADNGSVDGSQNLARAAGARVVNVPERGYGSALRHGIIEAKGRWVIMADADDSYGLDNLKPFIDELARGTELVMGNRFLGGIAPGAMPPLHRYLGNPILSMIGRIFFKAPCRDFHCGMRGFDRQSILSLKLRTSGMEYASEMLVRAVMEGLKIVEVPTTLSPDGRDRAPHLRTWRDGWRHLRFLLMYSPRWLFLYPGFLFTALGVIGVLVLGAKPVSIGVVHFGIQTQLICAGLLLAGQQLMWFALIAKVFAVRSGMHASDDRSNRWLTLLSVERCVIGGGAVIAVGIIGFLLNIAQWSNTSFGPLDPVKTMRFAIVYVVAMVIGTQTIFSGFLLSMVGVKRSSS